MAMACPRVEPDGCSARLHRGGFPGRTRGAPSGLWLDRVFAIKGSGTVVTGTLQAGTIRAGDELDGGPGHAAPRADRGRAVASAHRLPRSAASPGWR